MFSPRAYRFDPIGTDNQICNYRSGILKSYSHGSRIRYINVDDSLTKVQDVGWELLQQGFLETGTMHARHLMAVFWYVVIPVCTQRISRLPMPILSINPTTLLTTIVSTKVKSSLQHVLVNHRYRVRIPKPNIISQNIFHA